MSGESVGMLEMVRNEYGLSPRDHVIVREVAAGKPYAKAAKTAGCHINTVCRTMARPAARELLGRLVKEMDREFVRTHTATRFAAILGRMGSR